MTVLSHVDHLKAAVESVLDRIEALDVRRVALQADLDQVEIERAHLEELRRKVSSVLVDVAGLKEAPPLVRPPATGVPADPVVLPTPPADPRPARMRPAAKKRAKGVITPAEAGDVGRRPGRPPSVDYAEVAKVYLAAISEGRKPILALMDHFGVDRSTAKNWPSRLRRDGLLPPRDEPQVPSVAPVRAAPRYTSGSLVA
jgi:hypothetical protein